MSGPLRSDVGAGARGSAGGDGPGRPGPEGGRRLRPPGPAPRLKQAVAPHRPGRARAGRRRVQAGQEPVGERASTRVSARSTTTSPRRPHRRALRRGHHGDPRARGRWR
ncbi:hypothetical protein HBB16_01215 [Pseudonocardia sp. MCCB 268]|nr:hypothetical protein [Pseudonocardia cytotoxica]